MWGSASVPCRAAVRWPVPVTFARRAVLVPVRKSWQPCAMTSRTLSEQHGTTVLPSSTVDERGKPRANSNAFRLLEVLGATERDHLAYSELEELGEKSLGLDGQAVAEATVELHRCGRIAHFPGTAASSTVFLRPELSSKLVATTVAPAVPNDVTSDRFAMRMKETDLRYRPLQQQRDLVVKMATKKTARRMWAYFWAVAGQNVVFIWLIYDYSSWDLMEPVTYFYSQSLILFWWTYFIFNSREMSLTSWRQSYVDMYVERGLKEIGWTDETADTYRQLSETRQLCLERIQEQVIKSKLSHRYPWRRSVTNSYVDVGRLLAGGCQNSKVNSQTGVMVQ